jgi:hypothetical protein
VVASDERLWYSKAKYPEKGVMNAGESLVASDCCMLAAMVLHG